MTLQAPGECHRRAWRYLPGVLLLISLAAIGFALGVALGVAEWVRRRVMQRGGRQ